ncbi:MAG: DMT family transporter [Actinomycetota bacterium]|nr:DMT family transporter [Actinomycetota bacterium]
MASAHRRYWIQFALAGVAMVWGATFVMVKDAVALYPVYGFLGLRFAIAVAAFVVLFPKSIMRLSARTVGVGLVAGAFLCAGYVFQTWGLQGTTASKAAFITGMFVVITPVMQAVLLRRVPGWATVVGVVLAVGGLWLLSGGSGGGWTAGDTRVFLCAVAYSAHMIVLGSVGRDHDVGALTLVQLATTGVVCGGVSLAIERPGLPTDTSIWIALVVTGVLASAVAFAVQTYAQRHIPPARTALILISEPAFGGLFGWLAGEALGLSGLAGAALILGGMILAEMVGAKSDAHGKVVLEPAIEGPSVSVIETAKGGPRSRVSRSAGR